MVRMAKRRYVVLDVRVSVSVEVKKPDQTPFVAVIIRDIRAVSEANCFTLMVQTKSVVL